MTSAPCPQCDRPAEIVDRFSLASTSGPYEHVKIVCPGGHWFTLPAEDVEAVPQSVQDGAPAEAREPIRYRFSSPPLDVHPPKSRAGHGITSG
jgi:hypothetical protein